MTLSEWLKAKNMTAAEFARRIGRTRSAVGKWTSGERMPRRADLETIRELTEGAVTANDFLAGEEASAEQRLEAQPA